MFSVAFFRKNWGYETFLHIGAGYFFSGRTPPRGVGDEKTVILRSFFCAPPPPPRAPTEPLWNTAVSYCHHQPTPPPPMVFGKCLNSASRQPPMQA